MLVYYEVYGNPKKAVKKVRKEFPQSLKKIRSSH